MLRSRKLMHTLVRQGRWRPCLFVLLINTLLPCASTSAAQTPRGQTYLVTRVVDGDTIVLERIGKVRLIGVDTPETVDPRRPVQRFGRAASDFTKRTVEGKRVRVEYDWNRQDKYKRTLAYIYLEDGMLLNSEIIRQGFGFAYTRFPFRLMKEFRATEREAREQGRGLWGPPTSAAVQPQPGAPPASGPIVIHVTRRGTKYHRAECRLIARGSIAMPLDAAVKKYKPCEICRPPVP